MASGSGDSMAALAQRTPLLAERRFFLTMAIAMAVTIIAGFSTQLAFGRSSFGAPPLVHIHAVIFFGWTFFYVLQNALVASGSVALHRRMGWIGAGWASVIVLLGITTTVVMVRRGGSPFFFEPAYFLFMNSLSALGFGGLVASAIVQRNRAEWHRRLMLCGMAILTGPAIGRLLPMPLLIPNAGWAVYACVMIFPVIGMARDVRRTGTVHRAWWWGTGTITIIQIAMSALAYSTAGIAIYDATTAGSAGASVPPLQFPRPPFALN